MADNPFKYSEIFGDVQEGIKELISLMLKLDKSVEDSRKRISELGVELQKNTETNVEGAKKQQAIISALSNEEKQLIKIEKERAQAELEIQKTIKIQNQAAELAIKNSSSQKGAYKLLSDELNKLRKAYKDLAAEEKEESAEAKEMLKNITRLDAQIKKIDATVGQHQRNVGNYSKAWNSAKETIKGWGIAALAAVGASELWSSALKGSDLLADKWEQTVSGANAAVGYFATSLMTMDFSNFWEGLTSSIDSAVKLTQALDDIADRKRGIELQDAQANLQAKILEKTFRNQSKTEEERIAAAEKYDKILKNALESRLDLLQEEYDSELENIAIQAKIEKNKARFFIENYTSLLKIIPVYNKYNELIGQYNEEITNGNLSKAQSYKDEANQILKRNNISADEINFYNEVNPKIQDKKELLDQVFNTYTDLFNQQLRYEEETQKSMRAAIKLQIQLEKEENKNSQNLKTRSDLWRELKMQEVQTFEDSKKDEAAVLDRDLKKTEEIAEYKLLAQQSSIKLQQRSEENFTDSLNKDYDERKLNFKKYQEDNTKIAEKELLKRKEIEQAITDAMFTELEQIEDSFFDYKLTKLEQSQDAELKAAGDNESAQKRIKQKYARQERDLAIFQINLSTLMAVAKIWATQGYPAGIASTIAVSAQGAAQLIQTEAAYQSLKFKKGGHGVIYGKSHKDGGTFIPGVGEAEGGEYFSVFNKEATKKHQPIISDFTDAVNQNKLDLFALNFVPKIQVGNTDRLQDIAIKQLQVQRETKDILYKQKVLKGRTEIDINGNRTHYC